MGFFSSEHSNKNLRNLLLIIMATQDELVAQVGELRTQVQTLTAQGATLVTIITKVGTETDGLKKKIDDLISNPPTDLAALTAALADLKGDLTAHAATIQSGVDAATAVDQKVDDAV